MMKSKNTLNLLLLLLFSNITRLAHASAKLDSWIVTHPKDFDFSKPVPDIYQRQAESIFDSREQSLQISQMLLTDAEANRLRSSFGSIRGSARGYVEKEEYMYADEPLDDNSISAVTQSNNVLSSMPEQCDTPVNNYALFVIDGKLDTNSSYFKRNFGAYPVLAGPDYSKGDGISQHGLYVAWTISQIIRMGNNAWINGVTVFDSSGKASYGTIIAAFRYVIEQAAALKKRGINTGINASLNGPPLEAFNIVVTEAARSVDVTVSAGNKATQCTESPANAANVDAICALDPNGQPASYTSWGCGTKMICALGSIPVPAYYYPDRYTTFTGTSAAAPVIAAIKAARRSNYPNWIPADTSASLRADLQEIIPAPTSHVKAPIYAIPVNKLCPLDTRLFNQAYVSKSGSFSPLYRPLSNQFFGVKFTVRYSNARPHLKLGNANTLTIDGAGNKVFRQVLNLNGTQTVKKGTRLIAKGKAIEFVLTATNQNNNNTVDLYTVSSNKQLRKILHAFSANKIETVSFGGVGRGTVTYPTARRYIPGG